MNHIAAYLYPRLVMATTVLALLLASSCDAPPPVQPASTTPATQHCHPHGCGYIDFAAHPELIGGGLVLEPTE